MDLQILPQHFDRQVPPAVARDLFKASVHNVEIETFSFCNRTCWFCPNSFIDRRSENRYMEEALFLRIVGELGSIDYRQRINFARYNEPLSDRIILLRLRQARAAAPGAILYLHTNGDYLTRDYLDELRDAGLNCLRVQVYLGNDERYVEERILQRLQARLKALGLPHQMMRSMPQVRHTAAVEYPGMEVTFDVRNFEQIGTDRGQLVQIAPRAPRQVPCLVVFHSVYIDYTGAVVPCCNIRSDAPSHKEYVVDRLDAGRSIFEAYANSALADWRRHLLPFGPKKAPCDTCRYDVIVETPEIRAHFDRLAQALLSSSAVAAPTGAGAPVGGPGITVSNAAAQTNWVFPIK